MNQKLRLRNKKFARVDLSGLRFFYLLVFANCTLHLLHRYTDSVSVIFAIIT